MTHEPDDYGSPDPRQPVVKTLFALSGNACAFREPGLPACEQRLTDPAWDSVNARICHISGRRPGSARYDPTMTNAQRREFANLILLCPTHHVRIDELERDRFTVEMLREMKAKSEISAEPVERWSTPDRLDALSRESLARMRALWRVEDRSDDEPPGTDKVEQQLAIKPGPHGSLVIHNSGPSKATGVVVEVIEGDESLVDLASIQGSTIDVSEQLIVGYERGEVAFDDPSKGELGLSVRWFDESRHEQNNVSYVTLPIDS